MDIVERLMTESPSYVLIGDAAVYIEQLRDDLIKYKAGYEGAAEAAFMLNGKVEQLQEVLLDCIEVFGVTTDTQYWKAYDEVIAKARSALQQKDTE